MKIHRLHGLHRLHCFAFFCALLYPDPPFLAFLNFLVFFVALLFGGVFASLSKDLGAYLARRARKIAKGKKQGNPKKQGKGDLL